MLNDRQHRAIKALASGSSQRDAARVAGVSHPVVGRWLKDEEFSQRLEEVQQQVHEAHTEVTATYKDAMLGASRYSAECVDILMSIARNEALRPRDRIRAIEVILSKPERLSDLLAGYKRLPEDAANFLDGDGNSLDDLERSIEARILTLGQDD